MSTRELTNEEHNEEYTNDSEGFNGHSYKLLKIEYEKCRQKAHDLQRKLELKETMLHEIQEANELLERSVEQQALAKDKIISEITEKHRTVSTEYENIISSLENKLVAQTTEIEELRKRSNNCTKDESISSMRKSEYLSIKADNVELGNHVDQLLSIQQEDKQKLERAKTQIDELKAQCIEFEHCSQFLKEQLHDKDETIETLRAQLALNRAETASMNDAELAPECKSQKGNSLFAEVEDRRQSAVEKMKVLHGKYVEMKRACKLQIAEIKALRAKQVASLEKWEQVVNNSVAENELIQKYKSRVIDLQRKLQSQIKKNCDLEGHSNTDVSFEYFQSLLDAKRREIDELYMKVEDLSTKLLIQEEIQMDISKQLQYWRHKASILEAQLCTAQAESKLGIVNEVGYDDLNERDKLKDTCNYKATIKEKGSLTPFYDRPVIQDTDRNLQDSRDRGPSMKKETCEPCYTTESNKICTSEKSC